MRLPKILPHGKFEVNRLFSVESYCRSSPTGRIWNGYALNICGVSGSSFEVLNIWYTPSSLRRSYKDKHDNVRNVLEWLCILSWGWGFGLMYSLASLKEIITERCTYFGICIKKLTSDYSWNYCTILVYMYVYHGHYLHYVNKLLILIRYNSSLLVES